MPGCIGATASKHDDAAPAVAIVVGIFEGALAIDDQRGELDLAPVIHLAVFARRHAIHNLAELEVVQVIVGPAHDGLDDVVHAFQPAGASILRQIAGSTSSGVIATRTISSFMLPP
jgi:hypothetical protein